MAYGRLRLDHIAVVARNLDEGCSYIKDMLGVDMPKGGAHPRMGTHNRLVSLGGDTYLEVIAIDPDAPRPDRARWFNLDQFDEAPRIGTWILGTDNIDDALTCAHPQSGPAIDMARGDLTWRISVPEDGSMPMGGAFPSFIEWRADPHPARKMIDVGLRLKELRIEHPQAQEIEPVLAGRLDGVSIVFEIADHMRIVAQIETPFGTKTLF